MTKITNALLATALCSAAHAGGTHLAGNTSPINADGHAPIGVMGDHIHKKGEWMLSYRYMSMHMEDNISGSDSISSDDIVASLANPFSGPPTVRVVPIEMTTEMHMFGMMYAPSDQLTLMLMLNYIEKEMDHSTYNMMGTAELGQFKTETSGLGDTKVGALYGIYDQSGHNVHLNLGLSIPTGSIDEDGEVLTPMNTRPTIRLPYAMQLGSGTYDFDLGVTYYAHADSIGWGAQYIGTYRQGENDEDYTLGDVQKLTGWTSYRFQPSLSVSARLTFTDTDEIDGRDEEIAAPVQTANPDNYGGEKLLLGLGVNTVIQTGSLRGHRLALEYETVLDQDANGVQMEMQNMLTLGWQYAL